MDDKKFQYQCSVNPEHLFESPTEDFWCPLCDIALHPQLLPYNAPKPLKAEQTDTASQPMPLRIEQKPEAVKPAKRRENKRSEETTVKNGNQPAHDYSAQENKQKSSRNKQIPELVFGPHVWMKHLLNVTAFRNEQEIVFAKNDNEWQEANRNRIPAWCYPGYDSGLGGDFGLLYNYHAASHPDEIAPEGWHVPSFEEIKSLHEYSSEGFLADHFKHTVNIPLHHRLSMGTFVECGNKRILWTSSKKVVYTAIAFSIDDKRKTIGICQFDKSAGFFLRCIKS